VSSAVTIVLPPIARAVADFTAYVELPDGDPLYDALPPLSTYLAKTCSLPGVLNVMAADAEPAETVGLVASGELPPTSQNSTTPSPTVLASSAATVAVNVVDTPVTIVELFAGVVRVVVVPDFTLNGVDGESELPYELVPL